MLVLTFDRAEQKGAQPIPLRIVLQMVASAGLPSSAPAAGARNSPRNSGMDASTSLGDPLPGTSTGIIDSGSRTSVDARGRPTVADPRSPGNGGGLDPTPQPRVDRPVVNAGDSISTGPRRTGIPGVVLVPNPQADVSGMLTSPGVNITLESGTRLTLRVIRR